MLEESWDRWIPVLELSQKFDIKKITKRGSTLILNLSPRENSTRVLQLLFKDSVVFLQAHQ